MEKQKNGTGRSPFVMMGCGIFALVVFVICGGLVWLGMYANNVRSDLVRLETRLNAQYSSNQTVLDTHIVGIRERAGIAIVAGDEIEDILRGALEGRYGEGLGTGSPLFVAITEAYPEGSATEVAAMWSDISAAVADGRAAFKSAQNLLIADLANYDTWRESDLVRKFVLEFILGGTPSNTLKAQTANGVVRGQDAYDLMYQLVLSGDTRGAFDTGTYDGVRVDDLRNTPSPR